MKKLQFYLPDPTIQELDRIAKARDVTRSEVVRLALERFLTEITASKKTLTLTEFAGRMKNGKSKYADKQVTSIGPLHIVLPGDVIYDYYAEWDVPGLEACYDTDGTLSDQGYALKRKIDEERVQEAFRAYQEGYAYYVNVAGVSDSYNEVKGEDIAE